MYNNSSTSSEPLGINKEYGGGSGISEEPKKQSQTEQELGTLSTSLENLHSLIGQLEGRLSYTMRQELEGENQDIPQQELTPLADAIRSKRYQVVNACSKIKSILERLEI